MTKEEYEKMSFEKLMEWAIDHLDGVTTEYELKYLAKEEINNDDYYMAIHILKALDNNHYDAYYYRYDYSMGTLETPTVIMTKEDIEDLIDFED